MKENDEANRDGEPDALPKGVELSLTVTEGPDAGRSILIDRPKLIVGRGKVDFRLQDDSVSSRHFAVEITGGEARLRDLKTTNGTRVNGEPCDYVVLINQDVIEIGESRLVFRVQTQVHATAGSERSERTEPGGDPTADRMRAVEEALAGLPSDVTVRDGAAEQQAKVGVVRPDTAIFLEIIAGPDQGAVHDLSQPGIYLIGRGKGEIPLSDRKCSSKHAQIQVLGQDQYYLSDLASTNGTFLNEIRTGRRQLKHMDVIRIGETRLRFSAMSGTVPVAK